jgi:hypothetical protein
MAAPASAWTMRAACAARASELMDQFVEGLRRAGLR